MFTLANGIMRITKGDTAEIVVDLLDYEMASGDKLVFTARQKIGSEIWATKESSTNTIKLTPTETKRFAAGKGCYDIELRKANGDVHTLVGLTDSVKQNLVVYSEVTE